MFIKKRLDKLPDITLYAAMPFALFAVLSDVLIAVSLCVLLHGNRTGFKSTNTLITSLIVYAINRCLLTSVVAVIEVVVFAISPTSLWFVAIDFVVGKLYANSLLATLNQRNSLRGKGLETDASSTQMTDIRFRDTDPGSKGEVRVIDLKYTDQSEGISDGSKTARDGSVGPVLPDLEADQMPSMKFSV